MKIFCAEYMQAGSGVPVDCTVGLQSKAHTVLHARSVAGEKGYCGFWVSAKPEGSKELPKRLEFHPVFHAPGGKVTFGKVIIPDTSWKR